jgi:hypothetical protein
MIGMNKTTTYLQGQKKPCCTRPGTGPDVRRKKSRLFPEERKRAEMLEVKGSL